MSDELQRCPNCGAYVLGEADHCPRCDADLRQPAPPDSDPEEDTRDPDATDVFTAPAENDDSTLIADVDAAHDDAAPPTANVPPVTEILPTAVESEGDTPPPPEPDPEHGPAAETAAPPAQDESAPESSPEVAGDAAERTQPGTDHVAPVKGPLLDAGEMPTMQMDDLAEQEPDAVEFEAPASADDAATDATDAAAEAMHSTLPATGTPAPDVPEPAVYTVPPAPYTPPPVPTPPPPASIAPPPAPYAPPSGYYAQQPPQQPGHDPAVAYLQQRVNTYRHGGYRVETHGQYEAALRYGKRLTVGTLLLALVTIIGALWYLVILVMSGFQADTVYVVLENDGRVYEDGPGAAHIRRQRSRAGRRWSVFGLMIFFLSLLLAIPLGLVAGVVLTQDRYQAALREAYPAVTLFEEQFSDAQAAPDDVDLAKNGAVAFAVAGVLTAVGLWGGLTLFVIGTVHASAYRVRVPPLPGWA